MAAILTGAKTYFSKNVLVEKLFRLKLHLGYGNYRSDDFEGILETTRIDEKASRGKSEPKLPNCEEKVEVPHPLASMEIYNINCVSCMFSAESPFLRPASSRAVFNAEIQW
ncbi:hypothetical protein Acr_00g0079190 [Actinidia rufa]|uniref:Uncharacterized protein n=1 Tax=Actinidia rufa TaxID=165716 RepID=A0A7J0DTP9_9ERIC|nr:hypothetical protein Acr_00g0079190 [Actinidia rufa]